MNEEGRSEACPERVAACVPEVRPAWMGIEVALRTLVRLPAARASVLGNACGSAGIRAATDDADKAWRIEIEMARRAATARRTARRTPATRSAVQYNCANCPGYCCSYPVIVAHQIRRRPAREAFRPVARGSGEALHQEPARLQAHPAQEEGRALRHDLPLLRPGAPSLHGLRRAPRRLPLVPRQRPLRLLRLPDVRAPRAGRSGVRRADRSQLEHRTQKWGPVLGAQLRFCRSVQRSSDALRVVSRPAAPGRSSPTAPWGRRRGACRALRATMARRLAPCASPRTPARGRFR